MKERMASAKSLDAFPGLAAMMAANSGSEKRNASMRRGSLW